MEWFLLIVAGALLLGAVLLYNRLIHDRERVRQAWSDVSVQLKRRHELLPKLVEATRAYARFEENLLRESTQIRAQQGSFESAAAAAEQERMLGQTMGRLIAVAEAYPELQASEQWLHLQQNISTVELDIQYARRYYNGAVKALNVRVDSFPSNLLASLFGFHHAAFFAFEPTGGSTQP